MGVGRESVLGEFEGSAQRQLITTGTVPRNLVGFRDSAVRETRLFGLMLSRVTILTWITGGFDITCNSETRAEVGMASVNLHPSLIHSAIATQLPRPHTSTASNPSIHQLYALVHNWVQQVLLLIKKTTLNPKPKTLNPIFDMWIHRLLVSGTRTYYATYHHPETANPPLGLRV